MKCNTESNLRAYLYIRAATVARFEDAAFQQEKYRGIMLNKLVYSVVG